MARPFMHRKGIIMALFSKESKNTAEPLRVDEQFRHIAFIMDGNGRWAKKRGMPREFGHKAGAETFRKICAYCRDVGFKTVTVYAFSTENWKRPKQEVDAIMDLLSAFLDELMRDHEKYQNRIRFIGDTTVLPVHLKDRIAYAESLNPHSDITINIALNYGGRAELVRAFEKLAAQGKTSLTEEDVSNALYTYESGDPDMIVRTGGDLRISNFLLWQAAYAELYFTEKLWPDLTPADVDDMIRDFYSRKRRYGGL